ncbi:uncharacterized protein LOC113493933 [Trichoplusia ni]|uniref:Uncharacterized protein LOC113493933 n=1 Tax=Trichoplusia ni TaxID=7111 RepID=A0A7E5VHP2_TRINI|nr:uncharacterized protein LOC113493933 [Trichoplusia ni]
MKVFTIVMLLAAVIFVECGHTFMGTNIMRPVLLHQDVKYPSRMFRKRVEFFNYTMPMFYGRTIQGLLAYDLTHSDASANVTQGGIGYNFVQLRMKSGRGRDLHYDVYIY